MSDHELVYTQERDHVLLKLICHAAQDAPCRNVKSGWDFEDGSDILGKPRYEPYEGCIAQEHFECDQGLIPELQAGLGERFDLRKVPVSVHWDGDNWVWKREAEDPDPRKALNDFDARREALGESVNSGMERNLAEALRYVLEKGAF